MFFIAVAYVVLVAMATKIFHRFILGKVKVGLYFYLTIGILTKVLIFLVHMNLVQTAEFDELSWQTKGYFFLHATFTVFWLNIAFIHVHVAVHSGEHCGPWASGYS